MSGTDPRSGIPDECLWKNRLQEYTQKAAMPLPVYQTINEGLQREPSFRCRVWVDEICFTTPNTFSNRKMAEQAAAKHALVGIREKVKNEGSLRIREDTIFCKQIINEYAVKMNLKAPYYTTHESKVTFPIFFSTLVLDGVEYIGDAGKNKKDAEQFAARAAILSILGSESGSTMSEIVKSKFKFYDAVKKVQATPGDQGGTTPAAGVTLLENKGSHKELVLSGGCATGLFASSHSLADERKEAILGGCVTGSFATPHLLSDEGKEAALISGGVVTNSSTGCAHSSLVTCPTQASLSESPLGQLPNAQATHQHPHDLGKDNKPQMSSCSVAPAVSFVPTAPENTLMCSTSAKKRKRKNKKAKEKSQHQSMLGDQGGSMHGGVSLLEDKDSHKNMVVSGGCVSGSFAARNLSVSEKIEAILSGDGIGGSLAAGPQSSLVTCPKQVGLSGSPLELLPNTEVTHQPLHDLQKDKPQTSSSPIAPIILVPPVPVKPPTSVYYMQTR